MKSSKPTNDSVILLEFNELCPSLIQRFIGQGLLPNFQRFYEESHVYTTEAAERVPHVDPWIQWTTVHTGLNLADHGVERLNEGHKLTAKRVWDLISETGRRVWVCGSMSTNYRTPINGLVMPDPWTTHVAPSDPALLPYFNFVQRNVLEYTNKKVPLRTSDYLKFGLFLASHGLSPATVRAVIAQLRGERAGRGRWKRATVLDKIQFDVFRHYFRKISPHFSTFFLNSTAHFQHFYWRNMEPELFKVQPTEKEQREYAGAIRTGYVEMDGILGRFFDLAGDRVTLILSTAISQEPYLDFEERGGKIFYRPLDFPRLFDFAGINPYTFAPVMAHQFHLYLPDETLAIEAERKLLAFRVGEEPAMLVRRTGKQLFCECRLYTRVALDACITTGDGRQRPFFDVFYQVEGMRSGMHNPDGIFWVRRPAREHHVHPERVPLASVAPTILSLYGLPPSASMRTPSLVNEASSREQSRLSA